MRRAVVLLFGPPGAGKGTLAPKLAEFYRVPHISTGKMLRTEAAAGTARGLVLSDIMKKGGLVPDELVLQSLKARTSLSDCEHGFLLDGFPRTLGQAQMLDLMLSEMQQPVSEVVVLDVPDKALVERICGRWIHEASGRTYHVRRAPPRSLQVGDLLSQETMLDDVTGDPLVQRADDTEEAFARRLQEYHKSTVPIFEHYEPNGVVMRVNADVMPQQMWSAYEIAKKKSSL